MNKKTLYTLFCTTILFSGISLGAEELETPNLLQAKKKASAHPSLVAALQPGTTTPLGLEQVKKVKERVNALPDEEEIERQARQQGGHLGPVVYDQVAPHLKGQIRTANTDEAVRDVSKIKEDIAARRLERQRKLEKERELEAARQLVVDKQAVSTENVQALEKKARDIEAELKKREEAAAQKVAALESQLRMKEDELNSKIEELVRENEKLSQHNIASDTISQLYQGQQEDNRQKLLVLQEELSNTRLLLKDKALLLQIAEEKVNIFQTALTQSVAPVQRTLILEDVEEVLQPQATVTTPPAVQFVVSEGARTNATTTTNAGDDEDEELKLPTGLE